jgi:hypothetical protein
VLDHFHQDVPGKDAHVSVYRRKMQPQEERAQRMLRPIVLS